jgi:hypothetical protein
LHDYSLAHLTALHLSPPELVEAAAAGGYRYVGLRLTQVAAGDPVYPLESDVALMRETKARLRHTGVEVLDIELARMDPATAPESLQAFLEAGAELGARHVIAQLPDPSRERKIGRFAALCDLARPLAMTVDLEFPSWTETPNLAEAVEVVRAANRPNAGILALEHRGAGEAAAQLVPLCPCLRCGGGDPRQPGSADPHRARRAAVPRRGRHRCARHPRRAARRHSLRARDPARDPGRSAGREGMRAARAQGGAQAPGRCSGRGVAAIRPAGGVPAGCGARRVR